MIKFWFDKATIPTWVEVLSSIVFAVAFAVLIVSFI